MTVQEQVNRIRADIKAATNRSVTLVAVTKYTSDALMREAYAAGVRDFGENKMQTVLEKMERLPQELVENVNWHFIGHLQTKKVRKTVGRFRLIHSVDSTRLAEKLSAVNAEAGCVQSVLLQVNTSGEESKQGYRPESLRNEFAELCLLSGIKINGLMTMAPLGAEPGCIQAVFMGLRDLRDALEREHLIKLSELSMGMSQDYLHAIESGATILRIGSSIFQSVDALSQK